MHIDPYIVLGSAVVGLLVGMTGAGGGALMTPMLILLFGVKAPSAISSDLVAAVVMRPVGAMVHMRRGTVNYRLVGWLALGAVPMAFLGAFLLSLLGTGSAAPTHVEQALGAALLTGAAAMVIRWAMDVRGGQDRATALRDLVVRPLPTVVIGMIGGVIVGLTSVGIRLADDRPAAVPVPDDQREAAGRHRPDPGRAADAGGGTRRTRLWSCRVRRHGLDHPGQRARGSRRLPAVIQGAGQSTSGPSSCS